MKVGNGKQKRLRLDLYIFIPAVLISIIGIFTLLSTTIGNDGKFDYLSIVYKQIGFVVFGLITYLVVSKIDISLFKYVQIIIPIYLITIILLVLVFIFGPVINNVQRWLVVGGIQIQPS